MDRKCIAIVVRCNAQGEDSIWPNGGQQLWEFWVAIEWRTSDRGDREEKIVGSDQSGAVATPAIHAGPPSRVISL